MRARLVGHAYVMPAMALLAFMLILPSIYGLYYSLHDIRYLRATRFIGFDNYVYLFTDPEFLGVVLRSIVFTALAVTVTLAIGLGVALWIDQLSGWFALLVQIIVVLPWVISHVVGALLFRWVFVNDIGIGMYLLEQIGVTWFRPVSDPTTAMAVLVGFGCWRTLGFAMLLLLAGIKSIPRDLYEAAYVDGANAWQTLTAITLPLLKTPMLITLVILTVAHLNNIEGPLIVTGGGPADATNVLAHDLYMRAFAKFDYNTAIAMGIGMFIANIMLAVAYTRLVKSHA